MKFGNHDTFAKFYDHDKLTKEKRKRKGVEKTNEKKRKENNLNKIVGELHTLIFQTEMLHTHTSHTPNTHPNFLYHSLALGGVWVCSGICIGALSQTCMRSYE